MSLPLCVRVHWELLMSWPPFRLQHSSIASAKCRSKTLRPLHMRGRGRPAPRRILPRPTSNFTSWQNLIATTFTANHACLRCVSSTTPVSGYATAMYTRCGLLNLSFTRNSAGTLNRALLPSSRTQYASSTTAMRSPSRCTCSYCW